MGHPAERRDVLPFPERRPAHHHRFRWLLASLWEQGLRFRVVNGKLRAGPECLLTPRLRRIIAENRAGLAAAVEAGDRLAGQVQTLFERGLEVAGTPSGPLLLRPDSETYDVFPEGDKASAHALWAMQRDQDYCDSVHAGGAFDAVLRRCQDALAETERLVESLVGRGLRLRATGGTLWVGPRALVTDAVRREIEENRDRLVAYLT